MKMRFVINARSGHATAALPVVRTFAAKHDATVVMTERAGHGRELATRAASDGCEVVVAVGGDGTMNEVASALIDTPVALALVPCGSGDGLGRHLGIHGSVARALDLLENGEIRRIDSGLADGHAFFTAAGLGFEAEIAQRFNRLERRGFRRYLMTSFRLWREWPTQRYTIETGTEILDVEAFTLAVANANQYGNGARVAPDAQVDDGMLNLTAVPRPRLTNGLSMLARLFFGDIRRSAGVVARTGGRFVIRRPAPGPIHTDGEVHEAGDVVEFVIRPQSVRVVAPRNLQER